MLDTSLGMKLLTMKLMSPVGTVPPTLPLIFFLTLRRNTASSRKTSHPDPFPDLCAFCAPPPLPEGAGDFVFFENIRHFPFLGGGAGEATLRDDFVAINGCGEEKVEEEEEEEEEEEGGGEDCLTSLKISFVDSKIGMTGTSLASPASRNSTGSLIEPSRSRITSLGASMEPRILELVLPFICISYTCSEASRSST